MAAEKKPFHETVAEKLIEQLKAGTAPWQKPWEPGSQGFLPMNPTTGKRYKGINAIHLMAQGHGDNRWMTYKQAKTADAQVRKGEKGTAVQYWKFSEEQDKLDDNGKPVLDGQGKPVKETVMLERPRVFFATVFNAEQIDGMPPLERKEQTWDAVERAEHILKASGADIRHGEHDRAFYRPATNSIHLPDKEQFSTADNYYATALHELGHWTGHPSRLDRDLSHPFGSDGYAKEELRAEISSMILGDELGIGHDPGQHAAYVGSWIKALQDDPLEIFRASADAEKIHDYVLAFEQKQVQEQTQQQEAATVDALAVDIREVLNNPDVTFSHFEAYQGESLEQALRDRGLTTVGSVTGHDPGSFSDTAWTRLSPVFGVTPDHMDMGNPYLERKGLAQEFMLKAEQLHQARQLGQEASMQLPEQHEAEAWALGHLEHGTLARALDGANQDQIEKVSTVLDAMQPLSTQNDFWTRHELPQDVDALESKLQQAGDFLERRSLDTAVAEAQTAGDLAERLSLNDANSEKNEPEKAAKLERTYINVPYREKDEAKGLGARWDRQQQSWFVPPSVDTTPFAKWSQEAAQESQSQGQDQAQQQEQAQGQSAAQQKQYLAVPYGERGAAKAAGAQWDKAAKSWYIGPQGDMERLSRWLPDNVKSQQGPAMSPREEFAEAMKSLGCEVSGDHPIMDGKKHRVRVEGDQKGVGHNSGAGFYVGHLDGHPAGYISNNRTGVDMKWKSKGYSLDPAEKAKLQAEAAEKLAARAAELEQAQEATAERVSKQTANLMPATEQTPYMQNKGIQPHPGVLTDAEGKKTYIPAHDENGKQWTMQYIQEDGTKRFAKDSRKEGCFHIVGGDMKALEAAPALVIQEGYATAATNAEALGFVTVAAFDSGNLPNVAKALHDKFPDKPVVVLGDDDRHQELTQGTNPGKTKAQEAAKTVGGKATFPVFAPGEAEYPAGLAPITPQSYREHLRASKALETAPEERKADLQKALLSKDQLAALGHMKKHTDFNDLATNSSLGREGVERQVRATVGKAVQEAERKREKKLAEQQVYKQKRAARIGS